MKKNREVQHAKAIEKFLRVGVLKITLTMLGGAIALITLLYYVRQSQLPQPVEQIVERRDGTPAIEAQVTSIASNFICSCGGCGEQSLDICTCNTAIAEREDIRMLLQAGKIPDDVIRTIGAKYGGIKPGIELTGRSTEPSGKVPSPPIQTSH